MISRALYFEATRHVAVREEKIPEPGPGQVLVKNLFSAISPGSELLVYRGQAPQEMPTDLTIDALSGNLSFPLKYGYSTVGRVNSRSPMVDKTWHDNPVFSFQPHQSHYVAKLSELYPIPQTIAPEEALFLPNMETAVNLVMDGQPLIGESVVVLGQGIVGLLTTALLSKFPLERLITLETYPFRRNLSLKMGAHESLNPLDSNADTRLQEILMPRQGADLVYELSGNPAALNLAIELCGFAGRIVVGSWYGLKQANIDLGGKFHRSRIKLISSQVSTLSPELTGRWSKTRRLETAWQWIEKIKPGRLITRRFPLEQAKEAYRLLDENPGNDLQVVLEY